MDRRILLFVLSAALAIVLGFFALPADLAIQCVIFGGYWAMLLMTAIFGWLLLQIARESRRDFNDWRNRPKWPVALVAGCGMLLLLHEAYGFKILMDEVMLLGTSMNMHYHKTAMVAMRGHDILGAFQLMAGQLDKRPLFHPFLVSVLHDLTGYRPANVFALNTGLIFLLLGLVYNLGYLLSGRGAGAVAVLLLTSLPLLAQNATGGGFELLNLVMIMSTLLLGVRYINKRDDVSLNAYIISGILLANTRYESVLFLLPVAFTILWVWWSDRKPQLTWIVIAAPLLMLPYALHNKVFSVRESSWELAGQPGYDRPFAFGYLPDNISHALNFFFNATGDHSNSLVLSILGFCALPFFALWSIKTLIGLRESSPVRAAVALFSLGFALHTLLMLCYFWGKFDDPVIRRLSLPLNLALVVAVVVVAAEFKKPKWTWRGLALLTGVGFFAYSLPAMARHGYTLEYYIGREMEWRSDFIKEHPERDYLMIDKDSIFWVTHLVSATPTKQAIDKKENIIFNFRNHLFTNIYVFQRFDVEPKTGNVVVQKDDDLGPDYHLETVWQRRFTALTVSRISRVTSIDGGPTNLPSPPVATSPDMTAGEQEKIRQEYLETFIKRLP